MFENMIVDYIVADQCENQDAWYICYKCGKCGRKFKNGRMIDDGGTTVSDEDE